MYSRAGCHLCDQARETILAERARTPFRFEEVDIGADDRLERDYGLRIPVVEVDGQERFEYRVDPDQLRRLLTPARRPRRRPLGR